MDRNEMIDSIHMAAYMGDMALIVPYFKEGGDPSIRNKNYDTLLHSAVDGWQHRMAEFLILWGADVNAQNAQGDTPLHTLVRSREIPCHGEFIRDITPEEARSRTFLELGISHSDMNIQNIQGANVLHLAANGGDLTAIQQLLPFFRIRDISIDEFTGKGATALMLAIWEEHIECIEYLLANGADVNIKFHKDITPLHLLYSSENTALKAIYEKIINDHIDPTD